MFYLIQLLNGVQYGLLLFLLASGLTLIFGIMGVINLAHGSFYMVGAYLAYWLAGITGSFWLALPLGVGTALVIGVLLEVTLFSRLYKRDHLYQVLLTFGLILIFEELRSILFGDDVCTSRPISRMRYAGQLDEVDYWDLALTSSQVQEIYLAGSAGKPPSETGPPPERSGGSARIISARRRMIRARFSSGVSAAGATPSPSSGSGSVTNGTVASAA